MIIGKGSLFLGRLTNLADGASFIMERPCDRQADQGAPGREDVLEVLLGALEDLAVTLQKA